MKNRRLIVIVPLCVLAGCVLCALLGYVLLLFAPSHSPMSEEDMARRYRIALKEIPALDLESCGLVVTEREGLCFARRGEDMGLADSPRARELMGAEGQELPAPTAENTGPYIAYAGDIHRRVINCLENGWVERLAPDDTGRYAGVFYAELSKEGLALFASERNYDRAYLSLHFDGDTFLRYSLHCCEDGRFDSYAFGRIDYLPSFSSWGSPQEPDDKGALAHPPARRTASSRNASPVHRPLIPR